MNRATLEEAEVKCRRIGTLIGKDMPAGWGFTLILTSFGDNGYSTYLSNCQRPDMIKALREMADKLESGAPQR
ncbi:MAG: hypothetical protein KGZ65_04155 [Sphingomonadales bacterium]|nr:hypothetical protein [Sphingomonadaceae bacterium]MBS3930406.1 hypothetical protein [Sphingomonadales bacterium]